MRLAVVGVMAAGAALALSGCSKKAGEVPSGPGAERPANEIAAAQRGGASGAVPIPKAGKWKMTMSMPRAPRPVVTEVCLTPEMMSDVWGQMLMKESGVTCSEQSVRRQGAGVAAHAVCAMNGMKTTTDTFAEGDFNSRYTTTIVSRMDPAPSPDLAESKMTVLSERVGDC